MTNDTTQPDDAEADAGQGTEPGTTGSGKKDPTGVEGANPALDDTGNVKADEVGEAPEAPKDLHDLDLTPLGLSDEPAKEEDPESFAKPENS
jgi:hypothetical protein